ncbi:SRPBCC family protein [Aliiroseovarius sp. 2305UL8-7]|uniref:SRPBCC family protein n=1 Tax=Aliiroseovarius conchicola TaxID=3121637 RepID=UPI0035277F18
MIHHGRSLTIDADPEAVWAVLSRSMYVTEFAPQITSVDVLTDGNVGLGAKRRNHFANGTSVVEEVTVWKPGSGYTVELSDMTAKPLHEASSEIRITPTGGKSKVIWTFNYRVKYGPLGWPKRFVSADPERSV